MFSLSERHSIKAGRAGETEAIRDKPSCISLTGRLAGKQAVSSTYTYRIVLCVEITEHDVILHNIGSHDEVYG